MRWSPRRSTKPSPMQVASRKVAEDAFLAGKMAEGEQILKNERTKLDKTSAKKIAHLLAKQGRFDDATKMLLLSSWTAESAAKELELPPTAKVGEILYTSGGYEQTNVYFYEVVGVSGATATLRKINKRHVPAESTQYETAVMPIPGSYAGEPMKKRVQKATYGGPYKVKISDNVTAFLWDGKVKRETAAGYGH